MQRGCQLIITSERQPFAFTGKFTHTTWPRAQRCSSPSGFSLTPPVRIFFGVGTGRNGTMAIANALNAEPGVTCTHEGKFRYRETPGEQKLKFLTLENRLAYEQPEQAAALFASRRADIRDVAEKCGGTHFGDIAYNYAPFMDEIAQQFPDALMIVFFRNGVDFVRSATEATGEDAAPVGWPPLEKPLSALERFVSLGRLAPRKSDAMHARWDSLDHVGRNAWLWAETNKLLLRGIERRERGTTFVLRFEEFFGDPVHHYRLLKRFLRIESNGDAAEELLRTPINRRASKAIGTIESWTSRQREDFREIAGPVMRRLDYDCPT